MEALISNAAVAATSSMEIILRGELTYSSDRSLRWHAVDTASRRMAACAHAACTGVPLMQPASRANHAARLRMPLMQPGSTGGVVTLAELVQFARTLVGTLLAPEPRVMNSTR